MKEGKKGRKKERKKETEGKKDKPKVVTKNASTNRHNHGLQTIDFVIKLATIPQHSALHPLSREKSFQGNLEEEPSQNNLDTKRGR